MQDIFVIYIRFRNSFFVPQRGNVHLSLYQKEQWQCTTHSSFKWFHTDRLCPLVGETRELPKGINVFVVSNKIIFRLVFYSKDIFKCNVDLCVFILSTVCAWGKIETNNACSEVKTQNSFKFFASCSFLLLPCTVVKPPLDGVKRNQMNVHPLHQIKLFAYGQQEEFK